MAATTTQAWALHLVHNNGYDTILLTDRVGDVVSEWTVDTQVLGAFVREGGYPEAWDIQRYEGLEIESRPARIEDWGTLVLSRTVDGITIHDEPLATRRAEYWGVTAWEG